jgi:hypothetical protein
MNMRVVIGSLVALFFATEAHAQVTPTFPAVILKGSSSGLVTMEPGGAAAGTYNFNLPITPGTSGQVLTSGGGGSSPMTWASPSGLGTVTNVTGTAANGFNPSFANGTTTPTLTIATSGVTGMVKAVSNGLVSAVAGTDYLAPAGSGAALTGLTWSQIGSTPTTLAGYGITTGTGVATALGVNVGSAGAMVLFNGAGGTPSSLTLTNALGLPIAGLTGLGTGVGAALALAVDTAGGLGTIGTSGAAVGLLNGNLTFSGNDTFSGSLTLSGLSTGTQASCLGLTSGNLLALSTGACGAAGLTVNSTTIASSTANFLLYSDGTKLQQKTIASILTAGNGIAITGTTNATIAQSAPDRTSTISATILSTDMAGQVNFNGSSLTVTIPAISSTVFAAGLTATVCNYAASTLTISSTPAINGYTPSTIPAVSGGIASCLALTSNGVSLDAIPTSGGGGGGSGTVNSGTVGQIAVYAGSGTAVSGQTVASGVVLKGQGAAVPVASAITDNGSITSIAEAALTPPSALTDGATIATNAFLSDAFSVTIAGNRTLSNPTNLTAGQNIVWAITEDGTGGRTLALGTAFTMLNGGTFAINSAAGAKTILACYADSTSTLQCAGGAPVATLGTGTNCSSSAAPAVCASASAGSVAVPTGANPTLTVNTTAVTANSQILLNIDESLGTKLSVTCNSTLSTLVNPVVTARTAGTSFTIQIGSTLTANPACVSYVVVN